MRPTAGFAALSLGLLGALALAAQAGSLGRSPAAAPPAPGAFVQVQGLRLHALCAGAGSAILLIHGNPGSVLTWMDAVLPTLATGHRVCAVDRPGHGWSERGRGEAESVAGQARLLRDAARGLGLRRPVLVGHSWGGAAALAYALEFPEDVAGLALVAGVAYPDDSGFAEGADKIALLPIIGPLAVRAIGPFLAWPFLDRSLARGFAPDPVPPDYRDRVLPLWTGPAALQAISADNAALSSNLAALQTRYGEIRAPVAILVGDADRLVDPRRHGLRLHGVLPRAAVTLLRGAGHELNRTRTGAVVEVVVRLRGDTR